MVVDLGSEDARFAERAIQGFGLLGAGLIPQADADQDQEWDRSRRHQSEQLRADPSELTTAITPIDHA